MEGKNIWCVFVFVFLLAITVVLAQDLLPVPFKSQVPPGSWDNTLNCGQTSVAMVTSFWEDRDPNELDIKNFDDWMYKKYGDPINNYSGSVTNVTKLTELAKDLGYVDSYYGSVANIDWLRKKLEEGQPVIIAVHINMDTGKRGHFMVALAIDGSEIVVHDPGRSEGVGKYRRFPLDQFLSSWKKQDNSYVVIKSKFEKSIEQGQENTQLFVSEPQFTKSPSIQSKIFDPLKNLWGKIKGLFADEDKPGAVSLKGQEVESQRINEEAIEVTSVPIPVYNLHFQKNPLAFTSEPNAVLRISFEAQNTGNTPWLREATSLNVVGGKNQNAVYRHNSWVTDLRPARLIEDVVSPQGRGTFSFIIHTPVDPGDYRLQFQVVRQEGEKFIQIGQEFVTLQLHVGTGQDEVIKEVEIEAHPKPQKERESTSINVKEKTSPIIASPIVGPIVSAHGSEASSNNIFVHVKDVIKDTVTETVQNVVQTIESTTQNFVEEVKNLAEAIIPTTSANDDEVTSNEGGVEHQPDSTDVSSEEVPVLNTTSTSSDTLAPSIPILEIAPFDPVSKTLRLSWQSSDESGVSPHFSIEQKLDSGIFSLLQENVTSTEFFVSVEGGGVYTFRVQAFDDVLNASEWSEEKGVEVVFEYSKDVVINEITWMGTGPKFGAGDSGENDEWFELYNTTESDIDLSNWQILVSGEKIDWQKQSAIIPSHGYYVLERGSENAVLDVNADSVFTLENGIEDIGENIQIQNGDGEIIDEVNATSGWFAGSSEGGKYRSMKRLNALVSGSEATNWGTTEFPSPKGRGRGEDILYGSPGLPNFGFVLLKSLIPFHGNLTDENHTVTLSADNSPYYIDSLVTIPEGYILVVGPGVTFVGLRPSSFIEVKGILRLQGTVENPITFTSARDETKVSMNLSTVLGATPQAGDWSHLEIAPTGRVEGQYVEFHYGGYPFSKGNDWVFGTKQFAQVVANFGGILDLQNAVFTDSYVHARDQEFNSSVWLDVGATVNVLNSDFNGGYMALKQQGVGKLLAEGSTFRGFISPEGPVSLFHQPTLGSGNVFEENLFNGASLTNTLVENDIEMGPNANYLVGNIEVAAGVKLTLLPGTTFSMRPRSSITVRGTFRTEGQENAIVKILPFSEGSYWGNLSFVGGVGEMHFTELRRGNHAFVDPGQNNGMVRLENSQALFDHVSFLDARRPYNMIFSMNSSLDIRESALGWSSPKENRNWSIDGIKMIGGNILLKSTTFQNMDRGVEGYNGATGVSENMTLDHFVGIVNKNWWPDGLFLL